MKTKISVIIPTKNEEKNIDRCLKSIPPTAETIVVDNHSEDQTVAIAQKLGAQVFQAGPERSSQRNLGAKKAKGQHLLFLDADMELQKGVLIECLYLSQKEFKAVIIAEKISGQGFWNRCRALEKECYLGSDLIEAARFFEKRFFLSLDGYDENLIASEDWDLTQRARKAGVKIGRTKSFVLHHEKETHPFQAAKKKYYYGLNLGHYLKKHTRMALKQYQPLRLAFLCHFKKLASHPGLTLGLMILKLSEYLGGGLGLIRAKLK